MAFPPEKYDPLLMKLPIILGAPFMLFILGLGLEIVAGISKKNNVVHSDIVGASLSLFTIQKLIEADRLIIPNAVLWRELDWMVRMYQPFLVLADGNAKAEQSVLLNYVELGPILTIPRALKYKHRLAFISAITASITYLFQPFTSSVFQIRTIENSGPWEATSLETVALARDIDTLQAFVAGAGYADAAVIHNMTDPKFITGGWAMGRFDVATLQYGVEATNCPINPGGTIEEQVDFRPVMFCVKIESEVKSGNILKLEPLTSAIYENEVINGTQRGRAYNGVVFSNSSNPFIQARADAVRSILPAAIFRNMTVQPGGLDAVFDKPNGVLDATRKIYTQHLSVSAKGIYFQPAQSPLPGTVIQYENRLVVDPFPAHFLASILILTGIGGIIVHVLHRNQRKKLRLSAEPGSIGATMALTARSGFGTLLTPYDGELTMEKRLESLRFGLDKRTGAIIAESDDEGSVGGMVLFKTYTPKTLEPFNGKDGGRILLAINGIVFEVTAGRNFYGPNGMYGNFAGRDASRGMAKQSFDLEMLTPVDQPLDKLEDLQPDEIENMKGWIDHFSNKYIICGKLVENGQA
ncbi:hypothetical protein H1R20_g11092, partial [Candolleomyces eurysporus]